MAELDCTVKAETPGCLVEVETTEESWVDEAWVEWVEKGEAETEWNEVLGGRASEVDTFDKIPAEDPATWE